MPARPAHTRDLLVNLLEALQQRCDLCPDHLAAASGLGRERVARLLAGEGIPPWELVEAVVDALPPAEHDSGQRLRRLRSRLEAPDLDLPGAHSLCLSPHGGHLLQRSPGQLFCSEHGTRLSGDCPHCASRLRDLNHTSRFCPACGGPLFGVRRQVSAPTRGVRLAVFRREGEAAEASGSAADAGEVARHNREVGQLDPRGLRPRAAAHYRAARALHVAGGGAPFTRRQLIAIWPQHDASERATPEGSILPRSYCVDSRVSASTPWFLVARGRGRYAFIGLDGRGDGARPQRSGESPSGLARSAEGEAP